MDLATDLKRESMLETQQDLVTYKKPKMSAMRKIKMVKNKYQSGIPLF